MEFPSKETITFLNYLLPGFVSAWIFYSLTAHPKREAFERTVQALIFTIFIRAINALARDFWWKWIQPHHPAYWDKYDLPCSLTIAILLGVVFSIFANRDWLHSMLRYIGVTTRTSYPSEWFSVLKKFPRNIVLVLKDERRVMGYACEWPDQPERGHFLLENASWYFDDLGWVSFPQVRIQVIRVEDVESMQIMKVNTEISKTPEKLEETAAKIVADQQRVYDNLGQKQKEKEDAERTKPEPDGIGSGRPVSEPSIAASPIGGRTIGNGKPGTESKPAGVSVSGPATAPIATEEKVKQETKNV